MPLEWPRVMDRYAAGASVPTISGGKFLQVSGADESAIRIETPVWEAVLERANLEKAVELIENGTISSDPGLFVEDYMLYVSKVKATSVAHILRDLGFLDLTSTFTVRC
jgi:hypothetical protein